MEGDSRLTRPPVRDTSTIDIIAPSPTCSSIDSNQKPDFSTSPHHHDTTSRPSTRQSMNSGSSFDIHSRLTTIHSRATNMVDPTVQCPICCESMTMPKILPCLHNMCKKCLQNNILSYHRKQLQNDIQPTSFPCPVCSEDVKPPAKYLECEKWASQFPTNFFLHSYGMILAVQRGDVDCDPCSRRKETTLATWWCKECSEYQCNVCQTVHGGFKIFKHHDVIPIKEIASNPDKAVPKYEPCAIHKEKIIKFCREHRTPCCGECISTTHRKCDNVISVEEEFNSLKERGEIVKLGAILRDYEEMANELVDFRKKTLEDLETKKKDICELVRIIREGFEKDLRRLEEQLIKDFEELHAAEINNLLDLTTQCENLEKQISNAVKLITTVERSGNESHMISLVGKVSNECKKYENALRDGQGKLQNIDYDFQIDRGLANAFKTTNAFGSIGIKRSYHRSETLVVDNPYHQGVAKEVFKLHVWIAGDRGRCGIVGGVFLDDGRFLLADHDNFKLKLFQESGRVLSKLVLKSKPSDLAMVTDRRYVITFPSASGIQFIQLNGNLLKEDNFVDTARIYQGISCIGDTLYLISNSGIAVCNSEGREMEFIKLSEHGVPNFVSPRYIKATLSGFLVSDPDKNCVYSLTSDGQLVNTYKGKDVKLPHGIDVDTDGNVFVCCKTSSNVHQLTEDGHRVKIILSDKDTNNPILIRFQKYTNRFFISESRISSQDYITIYEVV